MKKMVEKRLAYLYSGELTSIIVFVPVSYMLNLAFPNLHLYSLFSFWVSFILLLFLLVQGAIYWHAKLKRLRNENVSITPIKIVRLLHRLKRLNIVLIMVAILAFTTDFIKWYPSFPIAGLTISFFIYIFAILEFINYFYIQLSYNNVSDFISLVTGRKWKDSSMNKDFKRMKV